MGVTYCLLRMQAMLKRKPWTDREGTRIRSEIRDNYEEVIFLDYALASRKDVEQNLWKLVFYRPIEDHRRRLRKLQTAHAAVELQQVPPHPRALQCITRSVS